MFSPELKNKIRLRFAFFCEGKSALAKNAKGKLHFSGVNFNIALYQQFFMIIICWALAPSINFHAKREVKITKIFLFILSLLKFINLIIDVSILRNPFYYRTA